jgi:hypothetical protein
MSSKKIIVSFSSTGRENYPKAQLGLIKSCVNAKWDGDYLIRSLDGYCDNYLGVDILLGSYPVTERFGVCNNHAEIPWGFKPDLILEAIEKGYDKIIWCDSTIRMKKNPYELLEYAKYHGVCAFDNLGHPLKNWISDVALEHLHITEEELQANNIPQIMACCIVFDVSNEIGRKVFIDWSLLSKDGACFQNYPSKREGFVVHRHDQAVLSGLLWKYKIPLLPYGKLVYPPHDSNFEYGDDIYFVNKGVN